MAHIPYLLAFDIPPIHAGIAWSLTRFAYALLFLSDLLPPPHSFVGSCPPRSLRSQGATRPSLPFAMSKKGGKSVKIFRIMVLGRVEVGKTCLCMQYTSNNTPTIYEHTEQPNYYIRDIDINKFQSKIIEGLPDGAAGKGESKAKDKKKKKKKESNERYGVHLVDVPGEIETEVLANTPEYDNIRNKKPQKPNVRPITVERRGGAGEGSPSGWGAHGLYDVEWYCAGVIGTRCV